MIAPWIIEEFGIVLTLSKYELPVTEFAQHIWRVLFLNCVVTNVLLTIE